MSAPQLSMIAPRPALLHPGYGMQVAAAREMARAPKAAHGMYALEDDGDAAYKPYAFRDGIAVLGVFGYLVDCMPWWGGRHVTGYDTLTYQSARAFDDDDVHGIVLNVDSYGGPVTACFDFIDWFVEAKTASGKPVASILSESAYSAGYAVASCGDSIAVPRTGGLGSIGVICMHANIKGALEKWGEEITLITAGVHKADGNPYGPLPDDVRAALQAEVEDLRKLFATTVSRNRSAAGADLSVEDVLATEARTYDGPAMLAQAVKLGLADVVASPSAAFEAFADFVKTERT